MLVAHGRRGEGVCGGRRRVLLLSLAFYLALARLFSRLVSSEDAAAASPSSSSNNSISNNNNKSSTTNPNAVVHATNEKDLLVYKLASKVPLTHLAEIDPSLLIPLDYHPIDAVHRNGWLHTGAWIHVLDRNFNILMLQRGPHLVTSPNAWSLVGEHSYQNEAPRVTVQRGLTEELGAHVWQHAVRVEQMTVGPLLYLKHYGPALQGRVDRQLTYMWLVILDVEHNDLPLQLDDEVANSKWITIDELRAWVQRDMASTNSRNRDFTYNETQELLLKGIELMLRATKQPSS